jgi:multidrug resistance efflux pump
MLVIIIVLTLIALWAVYRYLTRVTPQDSFINAEIADVSVPFNGYVTIEPLLSSQVVRLNQIVGTIDREDPVSAPMTYQSEGFVDTSAADNMPLKARLEGLRIEQAARREVLNRLATLNQAQRENEVEFFRRKRVEATQLLRVAQQQKEAAALNFEQAMLLPDSTVARARFEEAEQAMRFARAELEQRERDLERAKFLVAEGAVPGVRLEQAETELSKARAEVRATEVRVRQAQIELDAASRETAIRIARVNLQEAEDNLRAAQARVAQADAFVVAAERGLELDANRTAGIVSDPTVQYRLEIANLRGQERSVLGEISGNTARSQLQRESGSTSLTIPLDGTRSANLFTPVEGPIWEIVRQTGEYVLEGNPVLRVANSRRLWVEAYLNEGDAAHLKPGMKVTLQLPGVGRDQEGEIESIRAGISLPAIGSDVAIEPRQGLRDNTVAVRVKTDFSRLQSEMVYNMIGRKVKIEFPPKPLRLPFF